MSGLALIALATGVRVVEVDRAEACAYEDLEAAIAAQLGVRVSLVDEVEAEGGRLRYPVIGEAPAEHPTCPLDVECSICDRRERREQDEREQREARLWAETRVARRGGRT